MLPILPYGLNMEEYYTVDYVNCHYFDRVLNILGDFVKFKFLHSIQHGTNAGHTFDWLTRDDVVDVHLSYVF